MPKINQEEYKVLKGLDDKWKWIARTRWSRVYIYDHKPWKESAGWVNYNRFYRLNDDLFQFIQWEDESPYNIAELIEEYESAETEVKNIEWAKKIISLVIDAYRYDGQPLSWELLKGDITRILDQLDEPETLSQEWLDKYKCWDEELDAEFVYVEELENLLVPKQELPVIPQFVADWIEEVKPDNSLRVAFEYIAQQKRDNYDDELAFWVEEGNSETFARAWLDGYTVEKEQKYYVELLYGVLALHQFDDYYDVFDKEQIEGNKEWVYQFTEQEIKDYDERYWAFAVKVEEELEE